VEIETHAQENLVLRLLAACQLVLHLPHDASRIRHG
jgi:hypothetical protein